MWQTEDDEATCNVADDADVSFHMLSHKVRGTKKQIAHGPNPKVHRKLQIIIDITTQKIHQKLYEKLI